MESSSIDVRQRFREFAAELLRRHVGDSQVRGYCEDFLKREGALLNEGSVASIGYGAYLVFRALDGQELDQVIPPAVALDLLNLSIEVHDKIVDDEPPVGEGIWIPARMAIVASALQSLAFLAIRKLRVTSSRTKAVYFKLLGETSIGIISGGNLDLLLSEKDDATVRDSVTLAVSKSNALGTSMGRIGAMAAGAPYRVVEACAKFGGYVAVFAALVNDLNDARPGSEHKSDIRLKRKTPPVAFLLNRALGDRFAEARRLLCKEGPLDASEEAVVRQAVEESGALHFTAALADVFRYKAMGVLDSMEGQVDKGLLRRGLLKSRH